MGKEELHGEESDSTAVPPFADELRLVTDHLQLLDAEDRVRPADTAHHSKSKMSSSNVADSVEEVDEEWSSDEEENLSAKESGQDAMEYECS